MRGGEGSRSSGSEEIPRQGDDSTLEAVYLALVSEDDGRVCRDIPEAACREQPGNFLKHVASLALTKSGDGLSDPKLVLAWLFGALSVPVGLTGLLVPVREAGALLPQLLIAPWVRARPLRKHVWVLGSAVQGLAVLGMGAVALTLEGVQAGIVLVSLLLVFAVARAFCSVSYKDVLGKTLSKATRGTATGSAGTISAALALAFGAALSTGWLPLAVSSIAGVLCLAGGLWLGAALVFASLAEEPGATEGGASAAGVVRAQFGLLRRDRQLVRFIATRGLLTATALAPPYLLAAGGAQQEQGLGSLGPFVLAASAAGLCSTYVWGRLSDRSSRRVLMASGVLGGVPLALAGLAGWIVPQFAARVWILAGLLFLSMVAYRGVRLGRSTHLVDMAAPEERSAYTALSNTMVGLLLVLGGGFGWLAQWLGPAVVLLVFSGMCFAAAVVACGLEEVQASGGEA